MGWREDWEAEVAEAQLRVSYVINGREYRMIRYGEEEEKWGGGGETCRDCGVADTASFRLRSRVDLEKLTKEPRLLTTESPDNEPTRRRTR